MTTTKLVDAATKRCDHVLRDKTRCTGEAAGNWNTYGTKHDNPKWLCLGHAIQRGISKNARNAVFE